MATYNRAHLISETLQSVLQLEYTNWECIIVNDGGNDNTDIIVNTFIAKDPRIKYHYRPDTYQKGLPGCRNFGLDTANGDYIVFFDDDDMVHPKLLTYSLQALAQNSGFDYCHYYKMTFTDSRKISYHNEPFTFERYILPTDIDNVIMNHIMLASCTLVWRKESIAKERFNESLMFAEEWEYYARLIVKGKKGVMLTNTLYYNRKHPDSNTGKYWDKNPEKVKSKLEAVILVLTHLLTYSTISKNIIAYMMGILVSHGALRYVAKMNTVVQGNAHTLIMYYILYGKIALYRIFYKQRVLAE